MNHSDLDEIQDKYGFSLLNKVNNFFPDNGLLLLLLLVVVVVVVVVL